MHICKKKFDCLFAFLFFLFLFCFLFFLAMVSVQISDRGGASRQPTAVSHTTTDVNTDDEG